MTESKCSKIVFRMGKAKGEQEHFRKQLSCRKQMPCGNNYTRACHKVRVHSRKSYPYSHVVGIRWSFSQRKTLRSSTAKQCSSFVLNKYISPNTARTSECKLFTSFFEDFLNTCLQKGKKKSQLTRAFNKKKEAVRINATEIFIRQGKTFPRSVDKY